MELIVRQGGKERRIQIESATPHPIVTVDGRRYEVDAVAAGAVVRSLLMDGRQAEVGLRGRGGRYEVSSSRGRQIVEVLDPLTLLAEKSHAAGAEHGADRVTAYMPGRVVAILVSEGDAVVEGQGLLVLEAMKMENEIQAGRNGEIRKIFVSQGQAVEGGDPLYEIE